VGVEGEDGEEEDEVQHVDVLCFILLFAFDWE
jgi:hypothetical protein